MISLVWKEGPSRPIIVEQVLQRSDALRESGFDARVVIALPRNELDATDGFGPDLMLMSAGDMRSLVSAVRRAMMSFSPRLNTSRPALICRNAPVAFAALAARATTRFDWAVIYDARGWHKAQGVGRGNRLAKRSIQGWVERFAFRRADHNVVVSSSLLGVALALGADPARTSVIPPYTRRPGNAPGAPDQSADVVYLGNSKHFYQSRELTEPVLRGLAAALPEVQFGWLDAAATDGGTAIARNLWRRRVPPEAVETYLRRASVGLLIREPSGTNAVAFPTKALQYLAAGCRVVTTPYPPSVADSCTLTGNGRVVSSLDPEEWARAVGEMLEAKNRTPIDLRRSVVAAWSELLRNV